MSTQFRNCILLDTQSSKTLFCNPNLIQDIQEVPGQSLQVHTNAGTCLVTQQATLLEYGPVWFHPKAITNILSFSEVHNHPNYQAGFDQENDALLVKQLSTGIIIRFPNIGGKSKKPIRPYNRSHTFFGILLTNYGKHTTPTFMTIPLELTFIFAFKQEFIFFTPRRKNVNHSIMKFTLSKI